LGFPYSHVEAVKLAGDPSIPGAPDGEAYFGARMGSGVTWAPKGYDAHYQFDEIFVDVPVTDAQASRFWCFLLAQSGKPYDDALIATFAAGMFIGRRDWHETDHWICSELQAAACEAADVLRPFPQGKYAITPELHLTAVAQLPGVVLPPMMIDSHTAHMQPIRA
jgi:hypothetical protein